MSVVSAHHTQNLLVIHGLSFWTHVPKPLIVCGRVSCLAARRWQFGGAAIEMRVQHDPVGCCSWDGFTLYPSNKKNQHGSPTHREIDPNPVQVDLFMKEYWIWTAGDLNDFQHILSIFKTHGRWCDLMPRNSGVEHSSKSLGHSSQYCQGGSGVLPSPVWSCAIAGSSKLQQN